MAWQIAITLGAIGALVLFHGARAAEAPKPVAEAQAALPPPAPRERDPWARILVIAACAAGLLALGVIVVPAVTGNDSTVSTSPPVSQTTTTTTGTTTQPTSTSTSTSTTAPPTTIHLTPTSPTTNPTTTVPTKAPEGVVVVARATVKANG